MADINYRTGNGSITEMKTIASGGRLNPEIIKIGSDVIDTNIAGDGALVEAIAAKVSRLRDYAESICDNFVNRAAKMNSINEEVKKVEYYHFGSGMIR